MTVGSRARQGGPGSGTDAITGVETVLGSRFADSLGAATASATTSPAREGSDRLKGLGGNDFLDGGPGSGRRPDGGVGSDFCVKGETKVSLSVKLLVAARPLCCWRASAPAAAPPAGGVVVFWGCRPVDPGVQR